MSRRRRSTTQAAAVVVSGVVGAGVLVGLIALAVRPAEPAPPAPTSAVALATPSSDGVAVDAEWLAATAAAQGIPERALAAYGAADLGARATYGCAVGWNTIAGIGWVESRHGALEGGAVDGDGVARPAIIGIPLDGTNRTMAIPDTDGGALDGDAVWDRAVGPLQFIPETWAIWAVDADGDGRTDPHDIDDAAATAARYLCQAHGTLDSPEAWIGAIRSYNDTDDYQRQVAEAATRYAEGG
ncbi:lytic murein transglycosylase [Microbacterium barkeri]|uniref:lytic murein transglycosylase n=1 Tax=Microbacterium barkeri TaxID=33917 RepID=UPI0024AF9EFF|nr:lytic murein transglycosylase [Microbacterium barkeri]MDI6944916.1 lytic murein transglycosylase [Microbacterium barkeri]